jgi:hypothetical protein
MAGRPNTSSRLKATLQKTTKCETAVPSYARPTVSSKRKRREKVDTSEEKVFYITTHPRTTSQKDMSIRRHEIWSQRSIFPSSEGRKQQSIQTKFAELQPAANNDEGNDIEIRLGSSYMTNRFYLNQAVKNHQTKRFYLNQAVKKQRKRLFYLNQAITNQTKRGASNDIDIHKFRTTTGQK